MIENLIRSETFLTAFVVWPKHVIKISQKSRRVRLNIIKPDRRTDGQTNLDRLRENDSFSIIESGSISSSSACCIHPHKLNVVLYLKWCSLCKPSRLKLNRLGPNAVKLLTLIQVDGFSIHWRYYWKILQLFFFIISNNFCDFRPWTENLLVKFCNNFFCWWLFRKYASVNDKNQNNFYEQNFWEYISNPKILFMYIAKCILDVLFFNFQVNII